jgi:hypothetical protein
MPHTFDAYSTNLVNDILWASSQEEVNDLIAATMIVIEQKETDLLKRVALVERLKDELSLFNPFNKDAQQWSNITLARILLNRYLQQQRVVVTDED